MRDPRPFLEAIKADPDSDGPRLVFADWLQENGDAGRAEFVRVQCQLARWVSDLDRRTDLQRREAELLAAHGEEWASPVRRWANVWRWRRGLLDVIVPAANYLRRSRSEPARLDWVQAVRVIRATEPNRKALADCPHLGRVPSLDLRGLELEDAHVRALAAAAALAGVVELDLRHNRLTGASAHALADGPAGGRLRRLHFDGAGPADWPALADPPGTLVNSVGLRLRPVPAGTFLMGSPPSERERQADEGPVQPVAVTRPFYLGAFAVTRAQFRLAFPRRTSYRDRDHLPAGDVAWEDAVAFCEWLSKRPEEKAAGRVYRLPT